MRSALIRLLAGPKAGLAGYVLLFSVAGSGLLTAQAASYTFVGKDCGSSSYQMLNVSGTPKLGTTFHMLITGSNTGNKTAWTLNYLFTGFSNKSYGPIKLPYDISSLSLRNHKFCGLLRSNVVLVFQAPDRVRSVKVPFAVPNDRTLLGLSIFHQAFRLMGFYNPRYSTWSYFYDISRGGHGVIGT